MSTRLDKVRVALLTQIHRRPDKAPVQTAHVRMFHRGEVWEGLVRGCPQLRGRPGEVDEVL
eukprot:16428211-Heterocapsa_arctica.AAC.1